MKKRKTETAPETVAESKPVRDERSIGERWYEIEDRRMEEAFAEVLEEKKAGRKWEGWHG
jgi:hypothetical protein